MQHRNKKQSVEPAQELKELAEKPVEETEAQKAQKVLEDDAKVRITQCAQECAAICQKYGVILSAQTVLRNGQLPESQAIFIAK